MKIRKIIQVFSAALFVILAIATPIMLGGCSSTNDYDLTPPGPQFTTVVESIGITQGETLYAVGEVFAEHYKMIYITYRRFDNWRNTNFVISRGTPSRGMHLSRFHDRYNYIIDLVKFDTSTVGKNIAAQLKIYSPTIDDTIYLDFHIDVLENFIVSVEMASGWTPLAMFVGDQLLDEHLSYRTIRQTWHNGLVEALPVTMDMVSGFNSNTVGINRSLIINPLVPSRRSTSILYSIYPIAPVADFIRSIPITQTGQITFFYHNSLMRSSQGGVTQFSSNCFSYAFWFQNISAGGGMTLLPDGTLISHPRPLPALGAMTAEWYIQWATDSGFSNVVVRERNFFGNARQAYMYSHLNSGDGAMLEIVAELSYYCLIRGLVRVVHRDIFFRTATRFVLFTFEIPVDDCGRVWEMFDETFRTLIVNVN